MAELERRVAAFDPHLWLERKRAIARHYNYRKRLTSKELEAEKRERALYNPYAELDCALRLHEPIGKFLDRLKPSSTRQSEEIPWIYMANHHADRLPCPAKLGHDVAPQNKDADPGSFIVEARARLDKLSSFIKQNSKSDPASDQEKMTKTANVVVDAERIAATKDILELAKKYKVVTGQVGHCCCLFAALLSGHQLLHADPALVDPPCSAHFCKQILGRCCHCHGSDRTRNCCKGRPETQHDRYERA